MGVERTPNRSQHTKLILEKKILLLLLPGFELAIFQSQVRHSNQQAILTIMQVILHIQYTVLNKNFAFLLFCFFFNCHCKSSFEDLIPKPSKKIRTKHYCVFFIFCIGMLLIRDKPLFYSQQKLIPKYELKTKTNIGWQRKYFLVMNASQLSPTFVI